MATTDDPLGRYVSDRGGRREAEIHRTTQPALDVFQVGKLELLFDGESRRTPAVKPWVHGFETVEQIINWWQAAAVRSFGTLITEFDPRDIWRDGALRKRLLSDSREATEFRRRVMRSRIDPALHDAFKQLSQRATERLDSEGETETEKLAFDKIEPESEEYVAMMPSLTQLDVAQSNVLASLWDGFDDVDGLDRWVSTLDAATRGELDRDFAHKFMHDETNRRRVLADDGEHKQRLATFILLPAFARGASQLRGSERHSDAEGYHGAGEVA